MTLPLRLLLMETYIVQCIDHEIHTSTYLYIHSSDSLKPLLQTKLLQIELLPTPDLAKYCRGQCSAAFIDTSTSSVSGNHNDMTYSNYSILKGYYRK